MTLEVKLQKLNSVNNSGMVINCVDMQYMDNIVLIKGNLLR